ncbi:DNase I-like protein [Microstroma glucosiphilum]|uniref:DNase I-like protein n=1 Tax=Pseudomicrostroma glucosiphilum TaxID=1684307 RepID=A0A316UAY1_9BASI|nr:DNase I-like protein [Pseudomicrostroma glucosiphilum]PWN22376.1 DNase I-like protein [Pseudomicrostroma glucosiphilum]
MPSAHTPLRVQVATFNFNLQGAKDPFPDLQPLLIPTLSESRREYNASSLSSGREAPDIYAVGFQELLPLHEGFADSLAAQEVRAHTVREIKRALRPHAGVTRPDGMYPPGGGPEDYTLLGEAHLVSISLFVFGRDRAGIPSRVKEVRTSTAAAGVFNLLGNKGGVGVRLVMQTALQGKESNLTLEDSREVLTFVCAHLAAHDHMSPRRNEDFKTIVSRLAFPPSSAQPLPVVSDAGALPNLRTGGDTSKLQEKYDADRATQSERKRLAKRGVQAAVDGKTHGLYDAHHVFFFGDLNYRLDLGGGAGAGEKEQGQLTKEDVSKKVASKDFASLVPHDQLTINKKQGKVLQGMTEVDLKDAAFGPTYKFKPIRGKAATAAAAGDDKTKNAGKGDELSPKRVPGWPDRILWASVGKENDELQGLNVELYRSIMSYTISDHKPLTLLASLPSLPSSTQALLSNRSPYPLSSSWQSSRTLGIALDRLVGYIWSTLVLLGAGKLLLGAAEVAVLAVLGAWYLSSGAAAGGGGGDLGYWLGSLSGRP